MPPLDRREPGHRRLVPVTYEASNKAVETVRKRYQSGVVFEARDLWRRQPDGLEVVLHMAYYPGPTTDLFQIETIQNAVEIPSLHEVENVLVSHPDYTSHGDLTMYAGGKLRQRAWRQGRATYLHAIHNMGT